MSVSDRIYTSLVSYGGSTIDERVYNYLGSLGLTGTISDRLAKYSHNGKKGWQAIIEGFGLPLSAGFVKQELFGESQQGALYVPQPTYLGQQALYQDAAGTVPVEADGDPVGYMRDLSSNNNHATQSVSADRPIYHTDGARHWLEGDGIDDFMNLGRPFSPASTDLATFVAASLPPGTGRRAILVRGGSVDGYGVGVDLDTGEFIASVASSSTYYTAFATIPGTDFIGTLILTSDTIIARVNRDAEVSSPAVYVSADPGQESEIMTDLASQVVPSATGFYSGKFFGSVVVTVSPTDDGVLRTQQYLANLGGVTL